MRHALARWTGFLASPILLLFGASVRGDDDPVLADYFGFKPVEVYKLDQRIHNLLVKDLDGDKIDDIIVANNGHSRIDLLLSSPGPNDFDKLQKKAEPNPIESDRRMRLSSVPVNLAILSIQVGDFNGDGKPDLAFYGSPSELVVLHNQGKAKFGDPRRIAVGEALQRANILTVGDFNRDGKDDLALLSSEEVTFLIQGPDGRLGDPERTSHTAPNPGMIKATDIDGDGGDDLVILTGGDDSPFRIRLSTDSGKLGPEQRFKTETPRALAYGDFDGKKGSEIYAIENQSGRVLVLKLAEAEGNDNESRGRLMFYAFPQGSSRGRTLATGDIDGDKLVDVVATDPANSQFVVFRQNGKKGDGLGMGQAFPGLVGGKTVKIADFDGDGSGEVLVLSEQEKQIGRSSFKDNRLSFPSPLPVVGDPVVLETADLDGDKKPEVVYITRDKAKEGPDTYNLKALKYDGENKFSTYKWADAESVALKGVTGNPAGMTVLDANQDGQSDVLVFNAYGPPLLLTGATGKAPSIVANLGPLAKVSSSSMTVVNLDGPGIIVAQNNFARKLTLDKSGAWEVSDQYNSGQTSARIQAAAALDIDGDGTKEVVLLDDRSKALIYLSKKDGTYRPSGRLSVGALDFQGMSVADLDGDGRDDLLLAGSNRFGVVLTDKKSLLLKQVSSYEPSREESFFGDLVVGDLNADGVNDVAVMDTGDHFIEIATALNGGDLKRGMSFRVFEQRSFSERGDSAEPRDINVGDVDGDGRTDLVVISHNRILVYRQDPGSEKADQAQK